MLRTVPVPARESVAEAPDGLKVTVELFAMVREAQLIVPAVKVIAAELLMVTASVAVGTPVGNQFAPTFHEAGPAPPFQVFCAMAVPPMNSSAIKNNGIGNFR
jgi:hypothetical protein